MNKSDRSKDILITSLIVRYICPKTDLFSVPPNRPDLRVSGQRFYMFVSYCVDLNILTNYHLVCQLSLRCVHNKNKYATNKRLTRVSCNSNNREHRIKYELKSA